MGKRMHKDTRTAMLWILVVFVGLMAYVAVKPLLRNSSTETAAPMVTAEQGVAMASKVKGILLPWVARENEMEPDTPVRVHQVQFEPNTGDYGLVWVVLDLRYDPRSQSRPQQDVRNWAEGVVYLLAVHARPSDVRVSVWTVLSPSEVIPYGHARYRAADNQMRFEPGQGWKLLAGR